MNTKQHVISIQNSSNRLQLPYITYPHENLYQNKAKNTNLIRKTTFSILLLSCNLIKKPSTPQIKKQVSNTFTVDGQHSTFDIRNRGPQQCRTTSKYRQRVGFHKVPTNHQNLHKNLTKHTTNTLLTFKPNRKLLILC